MPTGSSSDDTPLVALSPLLDDGEESLILTTLWCSADGDGDDDEGVAGTQGRPAKKKAMTKADLQAQLAERDPYKLLELDELRWRASADDIKKAYRRMVLRHHPDKQMGAEAAEQRVSAKKAQRDSGKGGDDEDTDAAAEEKPDEDETDEMFKAITEAFEMLSDPKRRRDFDSLDDFDDSLPPKDFNAATHGDFYEVFAPVFSRNSRWSELPNAPLLGDANTPFDEVARFYNFWFEFRSWRDFADADEYDLETAGFREEKRWMERQNDKLREKKRKAERARLKKLVELSYQHDPRVLAENARAKEAKAAAKAERAAAAKREAEAKERAKAEKLQAEADAEKARAETEKAEAAERKRQKEKAAKAMTRARKRFRGLVFAEGATPLCDELACELLCTRLTSEKLDSLSATLEQAGSAGAQQRLLEAAVAAERAAVAKEEAAAAQRAAADAAEQAAAAKGDVRPAWTEDELSLLTKAANKFPGGVPDRWQRMAEFINHFAQPSHARTADEITAKVKANRQQLEKIKAKQIADSLGTKHAGKPGGGPPKDKPAAAPQEPPPRPPSSNAAEATAGSTPFTAAPAASAASAVVSEWSAEQQKALEQALKQFPASVGAERWERIAENVPGKTKGECVKRYKEIVAALKAKKEQAA